MDTLPYLPVNSIPETLSIKTLKQSTILIAALAALAISSCKTTEANYRSAYETTVAHQRERQGGLDTPELTATGALTPRPTEVSNGVTLPIATAWLRNEHNSNVTTRLDSVKRYNIVVARFRQSFNAGQMLSRLRRENYPEALVLKTADNYYVATSTTANPDTALARIRAVAADSSLRLKAPFPFILRPGHLAR